MAAAAPAGPPNLFSLHQYDGLTDFWSSQTFEYNGYVLPEVTFGIAMGPRS